MPSRKDRAVDKSRSPELSEAHWHAVLETARDAIISIDLDGYITLFNRSAERIFGYSAREVIGQDVRILMPWPYSDEHGRYLRAYHQTGIPRAIGRIREVQARRKNGQVFPIELAVSEMRLGDDVIYTAIVRDVGERKETEEALRRERDFAERLIETAPVIVLVLDTKGRIVRFNPYMEELSGYRLDEVRGKDWFSTMLPGRDRPLIRQVFRRALNEGDIRGNINPIVMKDGSEREIQWYAKALRNVHGQVIGILSIGQDITERKRTERELKQLREGAQRRERLADIGAIAAGIAHDLGNPLAALSMQAQLVLRRARRDEQQPLSTVLEAVNQIASEARRLGALVREFMDFAREQRLDIQPIPLRDFLQEVVDLWRPLAEATAVKLALDVRTDVPVLRADKDKLRRVLDNLLMNAVEAIGQAPGRVVVQLTVPANDKVRISVQDDGGGISENVQVFRLFETTKPQGTGLGLPVAREIIRAHGGEVSFERLEPHGTVFHVDLPC